MKIVWTIRNAYKYPTLSGKDNVVKRISYVCTCENRNTENGEMYDYSVRGNVILDTSNLDTFTEWKDLTNADIVGFVKEKLGAEKVSEIEDEAKLMSEFNKPNNSVSGLPE
tara:strand:- start:46 stop:378 length:333 start_codon:yes stop_codon:yes gene_type:complete